MAVTLQRHRYWATRQFISLEVKGNKLGKKKVTFQLNLTRYGKRMVCVYKRGISGKSTSKGREAKKYIQHSK